MHLRTTWTGFLAAAFVAVLSACGGTANIPQPPPGGNNPPPAGDGALDPGRGDLAYSQVLRNASGLPSGIRLHWTAEAGFSYNLYKSNTPIPDTARGEAAFQRTTGNTTGQFDDDFSDGAALPQIGESWYYRISAVDADGDESRLSAELKVDITLHVAQVLDKTSAAPGTQVTITGIHFGAFDAATDKVLVPGATWTGAAPGGFDLTTPLEAQIDSWDAASITITLPADFTAGPLGVVINGARADSPFLDNLNPYITSISPLSGTAAAAVTLQGRNFGTSVATSSVALGGQAAGLITLNNTTARFNPPVLHDYKLHAVQVFRGAAGSNTAQFTLENSDPVIGFSVSSTTGYGFLNAVFNLAGSTDVEDDVTGLPLVIDYDFDGDGAYDQLDGGLRVTHKYGTLGTHTVAVRVTDSDGAQVELSPATTLNVLPTSAGPWAMFGQNGAHQSTASVNGPQASAFPYRRYLTAGNVSTSPVFDIDGNAYFGDASGRIYCVAPDGTEAWRTNSYGVISKSLLVGRSGTVYAVTNGGQIVALNFDGTEKWATTHLTQPTSLVQGPDETIYYGTGAGTLIAFKDNGAGPTYPWQYPSGAAITGTPAVSDAGNIYFGNSAGRLVSIDAAGNLRWSFETASVADTIDGSPALSPLDDTVYFGSSDGNLYAVNDNGTSATLKWATAAGGPVASTPGLFINPNDNGSLYIYTGTTGGQFHAIRDDAAAGAVVSSVTGIPTLTAFTSPAIGLDGKVYTANANGRVYCFDPDTLAVNWEFDTGQPIFSSPSIGLDPARAAAPTQPLYVGTNSGALIAFGIPNPRAPVITSFSVNIQETSTQLGLNFLVAATSPENVPIANFNHDAENDGTVDAKVGANYAYTYAQPGIYTPSVAAVDANDEVSPVLTLALPLKVWSALELGNSVKTVRMANVGGHPAVAYIVDTLGPPAIRGIFFKRALDPAGRDWPLNATQVYSNNSLVVDDDIFDMVATSSGAGIAFAENGLLKYTFSTDNGASWLTTPATVTALGLLGYQDVALELVDGNPAVAVVLDGAVVVGRSVYLRATAANGSTWPGAPNHEFLASGGRFCDLAVIDGNPAVTLTGTDALGTETLFYTRSTTAQGATSPDWPALIFANGGALPGVLGPVALAEIRDTTGTAPLAAITTHLTGATEQLLYFDGIPAMTALPAPLVVNSGFLNTGHSLAAIKGQPAIAFGHDEGGAVPNDFFFRRPAEFFDSTIPGMRWDWTAANGSSSTRLNQMIGGATIGVTSSVAGLPSLADSTDISVEAVAYTESSGRLYFSRYPEGL